MRFTLISFFMLFFFSSPVFSGRLTVYVGEDFAALAAEGLQTRVVAGATHYELIDTWEKIEAPDPAPRGRSGFAFTEDAEGSLFMFFGSPYYDSEIWKYRFDRNAWSLFQPSGEMHAHEIINGDFIPEKNITVTFGGRKSSNYFSDLEIYDHSANTLTEFETEISSRQAACFYAGGYYYVFSGLGQNETMMSDFYRIDINNRAAEKIIFSGIQPKMRFSAAYNPDRNRALYFGGIRENTKNKPEFLNETHYFNPANNQFEAKGQALSPDLRSDCILSFDKTRKHFLMFGGFGPDPSLPGYPDVASKYFDDTWLFEPVSEAWVKKNPKISPSPRMRAGGVHSSKKGGIMLFGGIDGTNFLNDFWSYKTVSSGSITGILDTGGFTEDRLWEKAEWSADLPAGTAVNFRTRAGNSLPLSGDFSGPVTVSGSGILSPSGKYRYLEWKMDLLCPDFTANPKLRSLRLYYNTRPSPPVIVSPVQDEYVTVSEIEPMNIRISKSTDPDGDPLSYFLELSCAGDFSEIKYSSSAFKIDNEISIPLQLYMAEDTCFLRVRSFDGKAYSEWSNMQFYVKPDIRISYPESQGLVLAGLTNIIFDAPNISTSVPHSYSVYLSTVTGGQYAVFIASGMLTGPVMIPFDTLGFQNGQSYRLKINVAIPYGAHSKEGGYYFSISNANYPPEIRLVSPAGNETLSGGRYIRWEVSDKNRTDTHHVDIFLTYNGGASFPVNIASFLEGGQGRYFWLTNRFENGANCRIKLAVRDAAGLTSSFVSTASFSLMNVNNPPGVFSAVSPGEDAVLNGGEVSFDWTDSADEDLGDYAVYDLFLSSGSGALSYKDIQKSELNLSLGKNLTWYWSVSARDSGGEKTLMSGGTRHFEITDRYMKSPDKKCVLAFDSPLSAGEVTKIETAPGDISPLRAMPVSGFRDAGQKVYTVSRTVSGAPAEAVGGRLKLFYEDGNNDGIIDGTNLREDSLFLAYDDGANWLPVQGGASSRSEKYVSAVISKAGRYSLKANLFYAAGEPVYNLRNFPNPFNPDREKTNILYYLSENTGIKHEIFTLTGSLVTSFEFKAGSFGATGLPGGQQNRIEWDGRNGNGTVVADGIYILKLTAGTGDNEKILYRKIAVKK